ncbi:hydrogenase assembly protein HypC [Anaeromyxobacter paludicola]|uniref:Hydrogenase assembly protein HypC n=2 Tax=Anaeromyxobacter paludicola TaxID=2918171 RepID=A0ABM7X7X6_9BACT|nr:hydrogenase assembly protein HypC [Anaeromyxobacter paludicola]
MCLGIPGEILTVRTDGPVRFADVRFAGIVREVCLECLPDAVPGEFVLVHVGFAISRIDREEAERAYRALDVMGHTAELTADRADRERSGAPADAGGKPP